MARLAAVLAFVLCALAPSIAWAASPADLIAAYVVQRDDAVADARDAITAAGPGSPDARAAVAETRARLSSLAEALRATTPPEARGVVEARISADDRIGDAIADHGAARIDAAELDDALEDAAVHFDRTHEAAVARGGGLDAAGILQAVGGPLLLVGAVAWMSWRAARKRREGTASRG